MIFEANAVSEAKPQTAKPHNLYYRTQKVYSNGLPELRLRLRNTLPCGCLRYANSHLEGPKAHCSSRLLRAYSVARTADTYQTQNDYDVLVAVE